MEQFLQFKACKSGEIDAIGMEVAQQMKLSGCPTKGYFTTKMAKLRKHMQHSVLFIFLI